MSKLHDSSGAEVLKIIRDNNITNEVKLHELGELKKSIKHYQIPEPSISPLFEIARLCMTQQHAVLFSTGFAMLAHLLKRLHLQEPHYIIPQTGRLLPLVAERLGEAKERNRDIACQILVDIWRVCPQEVEMTIRDNVMTGKSVYAKQTGMMWISKTHEEYQLNFKSFVPRLMDALEDADGMVRETAKGTVVDLFRNAPDHAKVDLKKQLIQRRVRKTIASYILTQLGLSDEGGSAALPPKNSDRPRSAHQPQIRQEAQSYTATPAPQSPFAGSKAEPSPPASASGPVVEPGISQTVHTQKELEAIFRDMLPFFEGKESEQNWSNREKSILKLGNITRGNAPHEFTAAYLGGIKSLLDGILKTVNSLRTTVSTNGCQLVQEIARVVGPGLDSMVEILLQSLIKLCGGTKKISAANGNITVDAILGNVSYNLRLLQHIWGACQDKNIQPRRYATGWLKTIIMKHSNHKSHLEHTGGVELMQKCVVRGLEDSDKDVRESMRSTYWKFAAIWPDRAEIIMAALSVNYRKLLEIHPDNPDPSQHVMSASTLSKPASFSRSTTMPTGKPSLKDVMAAQKAAVAAKARTLPSRPGSAQSSFSPDKVPAPSVSGGLNSKPVRPMKAARRIEVPRPATADPYSVRRSTKTETATTPGQTAMRLKSKLPSPVASPSKTRPNSRRVGSPVVAPISHPSRPKNDFISPSKADEELTMVLPTSIRPSSKGSSSVKESAPYPELEILQVYEDPATNPSQQAPPSPIPKAPVLHELTLNEPSNPNVPSPARIQSQQELKRGAQESVPSSMSAENGQRLVNSGINRIEAGTLDIYGYRQLQKLIKTHSDLWSGSQTFSPLLNALLRCLERPIESSHSRTPSKSKIHQPIAPAKKNEPSKEVLKTLDLRSQALATIREMFNHNQPLFAPHLSQTLCSLLLSRRHYDQAYHIITSYDMLSASLVEVADPSPTIAAILDQLSSPSAAVTAAAAAADNKNSTTSMSVNVLRGLLHNASKHNIVLPQSQIQRLGAFTVAALQNNDPDVRRAITEYSNELYRHAGQGFWDLLADAPEQARNVVAWSLAKKGTLETRERTAT